MQTPYEQKRANIARGMTYTRRLALWLKGNPEGFEERMAFLDARYVYGSHLKRRWRVLWHPEAPGNLIPFPERSA